MARNFKQITSRMSREQREVQEDTNPKRSKVKQGSNQGGRRADPTMSQINTSIPTELKAKVFYHLKLNANRPDLKLNTNQRGAPKNLGELLEELLEEWVKKQGGTP